MLLLPAPARVHSTLLQSRSRVLPFLSPPSHLSPSPSPSPLHDINITITITTTPSYYLLLPPRSARTPPPSPLHHHLMYIDENIVTDTRCIFPSAPFHTAHLPRVLAEKTHYHHLITTTTLLSSSHEHLHLHALFRPSQLFSARTSEKHLLHIPALVHCPYPRCISNKISK